MNSKIIKLIITTILVASLFMGCASNETNQFNGVEVNDSSVEQIKISSFQQVGYGMITNDWNADIKTIVESNSVSGIKLSKEDKSLLSTLNNSYKNMDNLGGYSISGEKFAAYAETQVDVTIEQTYTVEYYNIALAKDANGTQYMFVSMQDNLEDYYDQELEITTKIVGHSNLLPGIIPALTYGNPVQAEAIKSYTKADGLILGNIVEFKNYKQPTSQTNSKPNNNSSVPTTVELYPTTPEQMRFNIAYYRDITEAKFGNDLSGMDFQTARVLEGSTGCVNCMLPVEYLLGDSDKYQCPICGATDCLQAIQ